MLIPLQAYLTLQQLSQAQQQQLSAAVAASSASGETSSNEGGSGSKEVHQIDGLPPVLQASNRQTIRQGENESSGVQQIDGLPGDGATASRQEGGENSEESSVVYRSDALLPNVSIDCGNTAMSKDLPLLSSNDSATNKHRNLETSDMDLGLASAVSNVGGQCVSLLEPRIVLANPKRKNVSQLESECGDDCLPNLQKSKSQSHKKKYGKAVFPNAEVIVQLDGPILGQGQGSKVIVQMDGNGSSSEDDSDGDEDSSEVSPYIINFILTCIWLVGLTSYLRNAHCNMLRKLHIPTNNSTFTKLYSG